MSPAFCLLIVAPCQEHASNLTPPKTEQETRRTLGVDKVVVVLGLVVGQARPNAGTVHKGAVLVGGGMGLRVPVSHGLLKDLRPLHVGEGGGDKPGPVVRSVLSLSVCCLVPQ